MCDYLFDMKEMHVFDAYGVPYLIHSDSSAIFKITPIAYTYLREREAGKGHEEVWKIIQQEYTDKVVSEFQGSLVNLLEGLKNLPTLPRVTREQMVKALMNHRQRNIMLFTTNVCNLRCTYCYERYPGREFDKRHLSKEQVFQIIDDYFVRSGGRAHLTVTFFGGEPLLNFEVLKTGVEYSRKKAQETGKSIYFCITTNATIMTDEIIEFLVDNRFGVMASIDGPEQIHDMHRKFPDGTGSYQKVAGNIKRLLSEQLKRGVLPLKIRATMTRYNYKEYDTLNEFFQREFPGARIMIGEAMGMIDRVNEWDVPSGDTTFQKEWFDNFRARLLNSSLEKVYPAFTGELLAMQQMYKKITSPKPNPDLPEICGVGRNMLAVSSEGKYYPCHRFIGMKPFVLGDTESGLNKDALEKFYTKLIDNYQKYCSSCWAKTFCGGDCPVYIAGECGSVSPPSDTRCDTLRRGYELAIATYYWIQENRPDIFKHFVTVKQNGEER